MKCPKCGFNSFEYYDSCKKCSNDLAGYKQTYSITPMVLPLEAKEMLAEQFRSTVSDTEQTSDSVEKHDDIFSFDIPEDSTVAPAPHNDDPFNFDDSAPEPAQAGGKKSDDDIFADLLESTSQADESPFGAVPTPSAAAVAPAKPAAQSAPGEFDLESFSWDDTPAEEPATGGKAPADDFDSLFGDAKEKTSK